MVNYLYTFDPGKTTGFSLWLNGALESWGTFQPDELYRWSENTLMETPVPTTGTITFLYEKLTIRQLSFSPIGFEIIGGLKFIACRENFNIIHQEPSQIQGVIKWPIYDFKKKGLSEHEKDSIAHGIIYYRKLGMDIYLPPQFIIKE